jgi:cytochrome c oxidase subunit IV
VLTSGILAFLSGKAAKAFSAANPEVIASHEATARWFCLVWAIILLLSALSSLNVRFRHWTAHAVLIALLLAQAGIAIQLGHLGGEIVFGILTNRLQVLSV